MGELESVPLSATTGVGVVKAAYCIYPAVGSAFALREQRLRMQERDRKTVTLVLGGVRSGKSRWAQELAEKAERVAYLATAQVCDAEMREKIRRHREDRPKHWQTFEEPLELARVLTDQAAEFDLLLVDCLTVFVANLIASEETDPASMEPRIEDFLAVLRSAPVSIVLVSNEVGSGVVPPYPLGRKYRDALGELNQRVAAIADNVVLLVAGLPLALKGSIGARP
jgi:adenosylcobinamide kinase/adenosylcobinamide-phosphate guanylyltransferase